MRPTTFTQTSNFAGYWTPDGIPSLSPPHRRISLDIRWKPNYEVAADITSMALVCEKGVKNNCPPKALQRHPMFYPSTPKKILFWPLRFLAPLVLLPNLCLLFRTEIIGNVERLAYFFWCLTLDHTCYSGTCQIKQWFDIHIVRSKEGDDFPVDIEVARMSELVKGMIEGESSFVGLWGLSNTCIVIVML